MSEFKEIKRNIQNNKYKIAKNDNFIENEEFKLFEKLHNNKPKRDVNRIIEFTQIKH